MLFLFSVLLLLSLQNYSTFQCIFIFCNLAKMYFLRNGNVGGVKS